ncbi:hypothetical protein ACJIZ3_022233 [Penstemon smallii]|uniref:Translation initiation factor IF2/IF5 domain-containing protein n=1 Tax=Penstemon smallii TaxID=265156 RepID=A0ABD3SNP5_9LAMI
MKPPQVFREGTKKTVFVNFMDLCTTMHRQPEHVMMFLLAEMGTSGSLDGQQSAKALIHRLLFLRCEQCGSGQSVAPIKAGFVARVGRRKQGT